MRREAPSRRTQDCCAAPLRAAALLGSCLDRRGAGGAGGEVEQASGEPVEMGENFGGRDDVGVFGVHVAEADGVAGFAAVEAAFFGEDHAVVEAESVDD